MSSRRSSNGASGKAAPRPISDCVMDSSRDRCGQSSRNHGAGVTLQRCPRHALLPASICPGWMVGDLRAPKGITEGITASLRFAFAFVFKALRDSMVGDLGIEPSMRLREGVTVPCHTLRPVAHLTMPSSACRGQIAVRSRPVKRQCGLHSRLRKGRARQWRD